MNKWYAMQRTPQALDINIMDEIGVWGVSASEFKAVLDEMDDGGEIRVSINSPGGAVFDGIAIYNLLAQRRERVSVEVYGIAASIASVIALAGRSLTMHQGALFMIHEPWSMTIGDSTEHRKTAEILDKIADQIVGIYRDNTTLTDEELDAAMKAETWYSPEDAVLAGFATDVGEQEAVAASARDFDLLKQFRNARVTGEIDERAHAPETEDSMESTQEMDVQAATPETVENKVDLAPITAAIDEAKKEIADVKDKLANISMGTKTMPDNPQDASKWFVDALMNINTKRGIPMDAAATVTTSDGFGIPVPASAEYLINLNHYSIARRFGAAIRGAGAQQTKFTTSVTKNAAAIISEGGDYGELAEPDSVTLDLYKIGGRYSLTEEADEDTILSAFAEFAKEAGVAVAKAENKFFLTGTGSSQPKGIFVETATETASATGAVTLAELRSLDEDLSQEWDVEGLWDGNSLDGYRGPVYLMHPSTAAAVRNVIAGDSSFVFTQDGLGRLINLFGRPVIRDSNIPEMEASAKAIALVNFGAYLIGERRPNLMLRVGADNDSHAITWDFNERVGGELWDSNGLGLLAMAES